MPNKKIHELPCPHFSELSEREQYDIMMAANSYQMMSQEEKENFDWKELYPAPTLAQQEFIDNLMHIIDQDSSIMFDVSYIELDDDEELAHAMFDGIKLDI